MLGKRKIEQITDKRTGVSESAYERLLGRVRDLQRVAYESIIDWFDDTIEAEGNKIKYSTGNLGKVQGVFGVLDRFARSFRRSILGEILIGTDEIIAANTDYFAEFAAVPDIREASRLSVLLRWGYNAKTGELVPGGYLGEVFQSAEAGQRVAALINQAITRQIGLNDFRKLFRGVFISKSGAGMIESRFKTVTFDLYQKIDRSANLIYADRLKLNNAVYSGTLIKTSRPFCTERLGGVFNRDEIAGWAELDFAGKPLIYDPFIDCGGHNCRHHLSFISDEMAEILKSQK